MTQTDPGRASILRTLLHRVERLATGVARRSRQMGWLGLVAALLGWFTLFGRWAFDSAGLVVTFLIVLVLLALPGIILLWFARLLGVTVVRSDESFGDVADLLVDSRSELGGEVAGLVKKPGLRSLGSLLAALWQLRSFRSDFGSAVGTVVGSARLFNPLFLLWVGMAALGVGLVLMLAAVGLVLAAF